MGVAFPLPCHPCTPSCCNPAHKYSMNEYSMNRVALLCPCSQELEAGPQKSEKGYLHNRNPYCSQELEAGPQKSENDRCHEPILVGFRYIELLQEAQG